MHADGNYDKINDPRFSNYQKRSADLLFPQPSRNSPATQLGGGGPLSGFRFVRFVRVRVSLRCTAGNNFRIMDNSFCTMDSKFCTTAKNLGNLGIIRCTTGNSFCTMDNNCCTMDNNFCITANNLGIMGNIRCTTGNTFYIMDNNLHYYGHHFLLRRRI